MKLVDSDPSEPTVVVERAVLRATFSAGFDLVVLEQELATAWASVVQGHGGAIDVLRVAHALDPRWHDPLGRPENRLPAAHGRRET
ncbi:MAG: hypothetical protein ACRD2W_11355 [Acidimicrobiales bacterium]